MIFSYYPGCSLESTACEYDESVRAVFRALGVELRELEDWNCCGASSAHSLSPALSRLLPARNLRIAQEAGYDVVMPCAACFNRHKSVDQELRRDARRREAVEQALGFQFSGEVAVRSLLDVICRDIGLERVMEQVKEPLVGLRAVGYYGCLLVRPPGITQFDDAEHPVWMDRLLSAVGAQPQPWSYATDCCGGSLSLTAPALAGRLVERLVERAREAGAQAIVTGCPLCQMNLEMRQSRAAQPMPVFYFTELIMVAFGLEGCDRLWKKHLIDPRAVLRSVMARASFARGQ
jgi:heterodisulfide reductase subunit B